jgi:hypothetical protein
VKDGSGSRVNVVAAVVARIRAAVGDLVMLASRFADLAVNAVRIQVFPEPIKTGIVIGKHPVEILEGETLWVIFAGCF